MPPAQPLETTEPIAPSVVQQDINSPLPYSTVEKQVATCPIPDTNTNVRIGGSFSRLLRFSTSRKLFPEKIREGIQVIHHQKPFPPIDAIEQAILEQFTIKRIWYAEGNVPFTKPDMEQFKSPTELLEYGFDESEGEEDNDDSDSSDSKVKEKGSSFPSRSSTDNCTEGDY